MRDSSSLKMIPYLTKKDAIVTYYDPSGEKNVFKKIKNCFYKKDIKSNCLSSDLIILLTEWDEFKSISFKNIVKNSTTGSLTSEMTISVYTATITVANGATSGKESSIGIPSNFIPMGVMVAVTTASSNNVNLNDIGTDADPDGFVDGISAGLNSTGFKGFFPCNGVLGMSGGTTTAATETADEVEVVVSGDPGGDTVIVLKFLGISSSSDAS